MLLGQKLGLFEVRWNSKTPDREQNQFYQMYLCRDGDHKWHEASCNNRHKLLDDLSEIR